MHLRTTWLRAIPLASLVSVVVSLVPAVATQADTLGTMPTRTMIQGVHRAGTWSWPVNEARRVLRDYDAPLTAYSTGHRGIDIEAPAGTPITAPASGLVTFAGDVVDRGVLSLRIDNYTASFEPILPSIGEGEFVERGQQLGIVSDGPHCVCLHVGVRKGQHYLSPMAFFSDVPAAVLMPWTSP